MFLNNSQSSQESTCVGVFFNKVAFPLNCNLVKKRLQHRFFAVNFERMVLKHQCVFLRTPLFIESLQWLLLAVSGFQPAALLKKGLQERRFSENFAKFLRTFFYRTPPDDCFFCLPVVLKRFSDHLLISCSSSEFQPPNTIKSISQVLFKHFIWKRGVAIRMRSFT